MSQTLEDLKAMRALLTPRHAWTKGVFARDAKGKACGVVGLDVPTCWCLYGALYRITGDDDDRVREAENLLCPHLPSGFTYIETFNDDDSTTHADILAFLDRAIAAEEARA